MLCKMQHIGKTETPFNICLNYHRPDIVDPNTISACRLVTQTNHQFNKHSRFTFIKAIPNEPRSSKTF